MDINEIKRGSKIEGVVTDVGVKIEDRRSARRLKEGEYYGQYIGEEGGEERQEDRKGSKMRIEKGYHRKAKVYHKMKRRGYYEGEEGWVHAISQYNQLHRGIRLFYEEAYYLYQQGRLVLREKDVDRLEGKMVQELRDSSIVYRHYREKGYIVRKGSKYGVDYLLYEQDPSIHHATYAILISNQMTMVRLQRNIRLIDAIHKQLIVCSVVEGKVESVKVERF